jgi:hypothetical protein
MLSSATVVLSSAVWFWYINSLSGTPVTFLPPSNYATQQQTDWRE